MEAAPVKRIPLEQVRPSKRFQPRKHFGEAGLEELAASIEKSGQAETAIVFAVEGAGEVRYELLAGERRWRAAQLAGLKEIPALVREVTNEEAVELALIDLRRVFDYDGFHREARALFASTMRVVNLADHAANAVHVDRLLVRCGALYHDLGKLSDKAQARPTR